MTLENKAITYKMAKYIIWIIIFVVPLVTTYNNIENRLSANEKSDEEVATHFKEESLIYKEYDKKIDDTTIKYAEISASLEWIKTTQQDILSRLSHNY